jgi:hypothetical protein
MEKINPLPRLRSEAAMSAVLAAAVRGVLESLEKAKLADSILSVRAGTRSVTIATHDSLANAELSHHREALAAACTALLRAAGRYARPEEVTIRFR